MSARGKRENGHYEEHRKFWSHAFLHWGKEATAMKKQIETDKLHAFLHGEEKQQSDKNANKIQVPYISA